MFDPPHQHFIPELARAASILLPLDVHVRRYPSVTVTGATYLHGKIHAVVPAEDYGMLYSGV